MGKIRRMAAEFQGQFQEAMREAEMADLKKDVDEVKATTGFTNFDPLADTKKDIERSFERQTGHSDATVTAPGEPTADALPEIDIPLPEPVTSLTAADYSPPPAAEPAAPAEPPDEAAPETARATAKAALKARHDPRGHRGHQGAADGASGRAALAADQGADGVRASMFVLLLLLRQADLQHPGLAFRVGGGPENSKFIYTALLEYFITQLKLAMFGAAFSRSRWWRRRSTCSSRPAFTATSARRSCRI